MFRGPSRTFENKKILQSGCPGRAASGLVGNVFRACGVCWSDLYGVFGQTVIVAIWEKNTAYSDRFKIS